ncbi:MAG: hypothetical protein ACOCXG_02350 [Nanoarchaeota archaeon]
MANAITPSGHKAVLDNKSRKIKDLQMKIEKLSKEKLDLLKENEDLKGKLDRCRPYDLGVEWIDY